MAASPVPPWHRRRRALDATRHGSQGIGALELHRLRIKVPVLSTTGEYDEVGPKTVEAHAKLIPGARFILYKDAAHVTSWDARDANVRDVREFLRSVDAR